MLKHVKKDIKASIVVFLVALPLCLGISLASGAPHLSGVLAGVIGAMVVGLFSNSHVSVSGPAAGLTVIVLSSVHLLGDFRVFALALFLAGAIQIILGLLRVGNIGSFFPNAVIKGMLAAIGLIVILKQTPHLLGFDKNLMGDEAFFLKEGGLNTFSAIYYALLSVNWGVLIISILSLASMLIWERQARKGSWFFQLLPSSLVAVILGVLVNRYIYVHFDFLNLTYDHFVSLPVSGGIESFLSSIQTPDWSAISNPTVFRVALTIAIVASLQTLLGIEAIDRLDPNKRETDKNRELCAQGIGNIFAGLVGALPISAIILRSSANISAGNKTKLSTIFHGIWLLVAIVCFPQLLQMIPLASLASILILIGLKLCSPSLFKSMYRSGKNQFIPFSVTILAILFSDLLIGILIGMLVGLIFVIKSSFRNSIVMVNKDSNYLIRFMKDVSFLHKPQMKKMLNRIPDNASVVIDGSNHLFVDNDIIATIEEFLEICGERSIKCEIIKSSLAMNDFFKS